MAKKFLTSIDMNLNEVRSALLHLLGAAPGSPSEGQVYHDTTLHKARFWNGSSWKAMDGTDARLDQLQAPTADVAMGAHKLTGLADPTLAQDASTKQYVDNATAGIANTLNAVKALGSANQALSGLLVVDGYQTVDADRVLLTGQTTGSQNGVWVAHAGAWTRPTDFATGSQHQGAYVFIEGGTTWPNTGWILNGTAVVTVDTTAETWTQFSGTGDITYSAPMQKSGNNVSLSYTPMQRKTFTLGDGAATSIALAHNLGTKEVVVSVRQASDDTEIECDVVHTDINTITLAFAVAPAANAIKAVVIG